MILCYNEKVGAEREKDGSEYICDSIFYIAYDVNYIGKYRTET